MSRVVIEFERTLAFGETDVSQNTIRIYTEDK